jgi:hypothetical protein
MTAQYLFRKETYREAKSGSLVVVETTWSESTASFVTKVLWHADPEDDVVFESSTEEEAIRRHEKISGSFRKYAMVWKLMSSEIAMPVHEQQVIVAVA